MTGGLRLETRKPGVARTLVRARRSAAVRLVGYARFYELMPRASTKDAACPGCKDSGLSTRRHERRQTSAGRLSLCGDSGIVLKTARRASAGASHSTAGSEVKIWRRVWATARPRRARC